jgi:hypothetical protein
MTIVSTHSFALFDYFRVPYRVDDRPGDLGRLETDAGTVVWPTTGEGPGFRRGLFLLDGVPVYASVADRATTEVWSRGLGSDWDEIASLTDHDGHTVSAVLRDRRGTLLLPFDPGDAMVSLWSEAYAGGGAVAAGRLKRQAMRAYYSVRPVLPRRSQIALRRAFTKVQLRRAFPRWPVETALDRLYELLFDWIAATFGTELPALAWWPDGKRWALVLTHDVEHQRGYAAISAMRDLETEHGFRSCWYLVPERDYVVDDETVRALRGDGFEVGVHGLRHDGRDLEAGILPERIAAMRQWADRWGAVGFRSPATHRSWALMPTLGFDYDSSSFDTDPFEPQSGGCCTWLPFTNGGLVELPLTLTMDHTVFVILRSDASLWVEKADVIRDHGGMAVLLTHPDYMLDRSRLDAYGSFLERYAADDTAWRALPREVSAWWRRRAASTIVLTPDGALQVDGPAAADARIVMLGGAGSR